MDSRNVQKTGDMFYLYLPTKWCKTNSISGTSKVGVQVQSDGSLAVYAKALKLKPIHLKMKASKASMDSIHKLVVACYTSPASSFQITLDKELDFTKILSQKELVSLELVEMSGNTITCESTLQVNDPSLLLMTMIRKAKNLLLVMSKKAPKELIERYEEEIDRTNLLIEKSVVSNLSQPAQSSYKPIDLHFIALVSKQLEHMADHLILLQKPEERVIKEISDILSKLRVLLEDSCENLSHTSVMPFLEAVNDIQLVKKGNYNLHRVTRSLSSIAEVMVDWAVVKESLGK